jgi:hypothetical protein
VRPKKPAKPSVLDAPVERFQRAPEHFGAHVDAEGGLQHRGLPLEADGLRERFRQRRLPGAFGSFLQDRVDDLRRRSARPVPHAARNCRQPALADRLRRSG